MASYNEEFNQYRIFLENIAKSVVPQDSDTVLIKAQHLRNRIICLSDAEGEVIYWILKFLDDKKCPTKLIAPIVRNVLVEIQNDPRYKEPNIEALSDLRGLATTILEGFCIRLLDNVELNKILDTATSHSAQQQLTDDLLSIPIRTAGASQNKRRKMEDRSICIDEFHKVYDMKGSPKSSFYGVFDGHIGYPAAQYAASQLPFNLSTDAVASTNPIDALYRAFKYTDEKFISKGITSGTTAACALYRPEEGRLFIAWVGDSKAMLAKQHGKIMQLVTPHRPELEREKNRIYSLGGSVHFVQGAFRVNGSLNVTRSIGDINQKKFLISLPDCVLVNLDKQEEFLVMATDGLWDHASDIDIARTVYECIKEDCENLDQIPSRLIKLAQDGNSTDNISVVVIFFKHPSQIAKNCDNLTIMESEFDNIKEVDYYNSRNFYPSDENTTSNSHAIDAKQLRWTPNDNLNNIINEEVKQTTTTTTTTTTSSNNGQFDDNLLYSSDNIDLNQKVPPPVGDDNNLHHASTLENNGEEFLATGYDNKSEQLSTEFDNDQQKILEKNHPHQQLGDTDADADYGPETCVDVTDDVVMMTENSADTNNLLEQSALSHSKDTLPSSDNCNPFDNKNTLDMEDANEFQLGGCGIDAHLQLDDANKSTPLLSPEVEDLPLSSDGGLQFTNEGFQQSPLDDEIPVAIGSHQQQNEFEDEFMQSNGHLSPVEIKNTEVQKLDVVQKSEEQEDIESLAKLERFGDFTEEKVKKEESNEKVGEDIVHQQTDLDDNFLGNPVESSVIQQEENTFENVDNDECDFRLKDEEEILEKHVEASFTEKDLKEPENVVLDLNQRDELQQTLQNLEDDILEEKPILTGSFIEKQITEINFDDLSMQTEEEKLSDFAEEKQDREEFSEKEGKVDEILEKLPLVEQKSVPSEGLELEEDECIHLDEDVRPSDYLAMLERQKEEHQQLCKVVEGFDREVQMDEEEPRIEDGKVEQSENKPELEQISDNAAEEELHEGYYKESEKVEQLEEPVFEESDRLSNKVEQEFEKVERLSENEEEREDEGLSGQLEQLDNEKFTEQPEHLEKEQPYETDDDKLPEKSEEQLVKAHQEDEELHELREQPEQLEKEQPYETDDKLPEKSEEQLVKAHQEDEQLHELREQPEQLEKEQPYETDDKLPEISEEQLVKAHQEDEKLHELSEKQHQADEKLDKQVEQIEENEHYDIDESLSVGTEQLEQERHLDDIEIMSQQFDRFEKEDEAEDRFNAQVEQQFEGDASQTELVKNVEPNDRLNEQIERLEELKRELQQQDGSQVIEIKEDILNQETEQFSDNNKLESEVGSLAEEHTPVVEDSIAQPEKQCFEEPEKLAKEAIDNLVIQQEQPADRDEVPENKQIDDDSCEESGPPLEECTEEQLARVELQVLAATPVQSVEKENKHIEKVEEDPEELVEVVEETIIKEQVEIKPGTLSVSSQEPSAALPTHESCDESEDDEWKYMKEGQGEKQLLSLQSAIVVEEELQQQLQEDGAFSIDEKLQPTATTLTEQISATASDQIESIKDTFESLTQNIAELAESAAALTEPEVDKIGDALENLNLSQSSTREKLDNIDDEDISASEMNSKLNPEAKEFVPTFSPTAPVELANGFGIPTATAIPHHFKDELLAQSPRKGRESNMENINIPAENEFEEEIANKPHGLPGDEAIIEHAENGGLYQEMNWKEAMHGSEKEEGPLIDSPVTEESLEVVDNVLQYATAPNLLEFSAPVDLDNAGMKESIYIENNTSVQSNEEDVLNTVQVLPVEDSESKDTSFELVNASKEEVISPPVASVPEKDAVTKEDVREILTLASDEKKENKIDDGFEHKMEQLLLSHDKEITKDVQLETEQVPINGVEMSPSAPEVAIIEAVESVVAVEPVIEQPQQPTVPVELASSPVPIAEEALEGLTLGAAAAVAVAATTAAVKKVEAEKNQKNLNKTSSATKSKVPDTKKPTPGAAAKTIAAKRTLGDKPKPAATASSLANKKTVSSTTSAAPRPRTAPSVGAVRTSTDKKTTTAGTSTTKSRIDTKTPSTLTTRKPLTSSATKTTTSKPADEVKSSSTTVKSTSSTKSVVGSKTSFGSSTKAPSATNSITKPRPATASSVGTTNGTASKTAASKPTTLAPKVAANTKPSLTSPRGTLTSTLRKTEAIKSPTKTTTSTITSRVNNSTNGTNKTTTTTRTTTSKTTLSTVPTAAARSTGTTTTTTRRTITGTSSTGGATTPTSKTNNLVPRKSTPLKKTITNSSSTPSARKSIGSHLNASAQKPTKDTTTPRPVTIPAHHQNNNSIVAEQPKDIPLVSNATSIPPTDNGEPKLNGIASPDDVTSPTAPVAHPLEMEIA